METIVMRILIWAVFGVVSCLFSGCSLVTCAAGGGFNFSSSPYSSWESFQHEGERFLISPHGKNEYYIRKYDCFLWGSVDHPVKMMIGSFFCSTRDFRTSAFTIRAKRSSWMCGKIPNGALMPTDTASGCRYAIGTGGMRL